MTRLDPDFGSGVVEYALHLGGTAGSLSVQSRLPKIVLPASIAIENHLTLDTGAGQATRKVSGQLQEPAALSASPFSAFTTFRKAGLRHILTGYDNVFLVMCFALGIGWSNRLFWVVTAFTLGHSVTLVLGAMGLVLQIPWFIPAIDAGIVLSVVFAAWSAWQN